MRAAIGLPSHWFPRKPMGTPCTLLMGLSEVCAVGTFGFAAGLAYQGLGRSVRHSSKDISGPPGPSTLQWLSPHPVSSAFIRTEEDVHFRGKL